MQRVCWFVRRSMLGQRATTAQASRTHAPLRGRAGGVHRATCGALRTCDGRGPVRLFGHGRDHAMLHAPRRWTRHIRTLHAGAALTQPLAASSNSSAGRGGNSDARAVPGDSTTLGIRELVHSINVAIAAGKRVDVGEVQHALLTAAGAGRMVDAGRLLSSLSRAGLRLGDGDYRDAVRSLGDTLMRQASTTGDLDVATSILHQVSGGVAGGTAQA